MSSGVPSVPPQSGPVRSRKDVYEIPPSVAALLGPRYDDLVARFNDEGRPNRSLVRLDALGDDTVQVPETSYLRRLGSHNRDTHRRFSYRGTQAWYKERLQR